MRPEGRVDVVIGTQPSGQGHETSFAQVVADLLSVPLETVKIILGDTDVVKVGGGSHSGRSMRHAATVFSKAAGRSHREGKRVAAAILGKTPDQIEFDDGRFSCARHQPHRSISSSSPRRRPSTRCPTDLKDGIAVVTDNEMHEPVFPNGCAVCEVEIDPDTGALELTRYASVDDVGRCINPLIVHGQTHGAIVQGIGQALWEQCYVESDSGQPLIGSLMDYGLPRADALPSFRDRDRRGAVADQSARHQGRRRRRHHGGAGRDRQRDRRCAARVRRARHQDAGDAVRYLAGHPRRQDGGEQRIGHFADPRTPQNNREDNR